MYTVNGYRELQMDTGILYSFCGEAKNPDIFSGNREFSCILQGSKWYTGTPCSPCGENIYSVEAYERRTVFFNHLFPTTVNSCQDRQLPILIAPVHKDSFWREIVQKKCSILIIDLEYT